MTLSTFNHSQRCYYLLALSMTLSTFRHSQRPFICTKSHNTSQLPDPTYPAYPAIFFPGLFGPGRVISYALAMPIIWGEVTALTSDPAYPAILFPSRSSPGRAYVSYAIPGNQFLHSPVTLRTWRYCFLAYSVLRELVSYAIPATSSCTHQ